MCDDRGGEIYYLSPVSNSRLGNCKQIFTEIFKYFQESQTLSFKHCQDFFVNTNMRPDVRIEMFGLKKNVDEN